ncbi:hypothetical protein JCM11491_006995 [Sporobolomyces phaffii]
MSTSKPSGSCVVCGKNTTTRCGGCAAVGYDFLYFCSREHQKLVWPMHKKVCSKPFRWPSLTAREAESMKALYPPGDDFRRIIERHVPGKLEQYIDSVTVERDALFTDAELYGERNGSCMTIRKYGYMKRIATATGLYAPPGGQIVYNCLSEDPFGALIHWETEHWPDLPTMAVEVHPWTARLQHVAIIAFALAAEANDKVYARCPDLMMHTVYALEQVMVEALAARKHDHEHATSLQLGAQEVLSRLVKGKMTLT